MVQFQLRSDERHNSLALLHKRECYADEVIEEDSRMPGCPMSRALGT